MVKLKPSPNSPVPPWWWFLGMLVSMPTMAWLVFSPSDGCANHPYMLVCENPLELEQPYLGLWIVHWLGLCVGFFPFAGLLMMGLMAAWDRWVIGIGRPE